MNRSCLAWVGWVLVASGPTFADEEEFPPLLPPEQQIDEDLKESLQRVFPKPPQRSVPPRSTSTTDLRAALRDGITLGLGVGADWVRLDGMKLRERNHYGGGQDLDLDPLELDGGQAVLKMFLTKRVRVGSRGMRAVFGLEGAHRLGRLADSRKIASGDDLAGAAVGRARFRGGDTMKVEVELQLWDLDSLLRVEVEAVSFEVRLGFRYAHLRTEARAGDDPADREETRVEAMMPSLGLGVLVRPIEALELFFRARIAEVGSTRDGVLVGHRISRLRARSHELEGGFTIRIADTFAIVAGYRLVSFMLHKKKWGSSGDEYGMLVQRPLSHDARITSRVHGPFLELMLEF